MRVELAKGFLIQTYMFIFVTLNLDHKRQLKLILAVKYPIFSHPCLLSNRWNCFSSVLSFVYDRQFANMWQVLIFRLQKHVWPHHDVLASFSVLLFLKSTNFLNLETPRSLWHLLSQEKWGQNWHKMSFSNDLWH